MIIQRKYPEATFNGMFCNWYNVNKFPREKSFSATVIIVGNLSDRGVTNIGDNYMTDGQPVVYSVGNRGCGA